MLDVTFSAFVLILGLLLATYFAFQVSSDVVGGMRMRNRMDDSFKLMSEADYLQTFDANIISDEFAMLIPVNYGYNAVIEGYSYSGNFTQEDSFTIGSTIPTEKNLISGRYYFVKIEDNEISRYGLVKYKVWLK